MSESRGGNFFTELLKFILIAVIIVVPIRLWVAQPFIVSGISMQPTFATGQYLIIDELDYHFSNPQRGDIIIFRYPKNPSEFFIKRVIGLPGETVEISNDSVTIVEKNGEKETLPEPFLKYRGNGAPEVTVLGPSEYFVMGDNRPDSSDSRAWGPVPRQNIIGRVFLRLLPISKIGFFPGKYTFPPVSSSTTAQAGGITSTSTIVSMTVSP